MPVKIGLVGLPNVGKSSLFNFLTKKNIKDIANYPFATIKPNVGVMPLLDPRLKKLSQFWQSPSVPSIVEIIDIAGLVKGASKGLGLANYSGEEIEIKEIKKYAEKMKLSFFTLAVKLEKEMEELSEKEKEEMN
nr:12472_t:CDS:2 [Entrophospora candida]